MFRELSESCPVGIFHTDARGQVIYGNPEHKPGHVAKIAAQFGRIAMGAAAGKTSLPPRSCGRCPACGGDHSLVKFSVTPTERTKAGCKPRQR